MLTLTVFAVGTIAALLFVVYEFYTLNRRHYYHIYPAFLVLVGGCAFIPIANIVVTLAFVVWALLGWRYTAVGEVVRKPKRQFIFNRR